MNRGGVFAQTRCFTTTTTVDQYLTFVSFPQSFSFYLITSYNSREDCCFSLTESLVPYMLCFKLQHPDRLASNVAYNRTKLYLFGLYVIAFIFIFVEPFLLLPHGTDLLIGTARRMVPSSFSSRLAEIGYLADSAEQKSKLICHSLTTENKATRNALDTFVVPSTKSLQVSNQFMTCTCHLIQIIIFKSSVSPRLYSNRDGIREEKKIYQRSGNLS